MNIKESLEKVKEDLAMLYIWKISGKSFTECLSLLKKRLLKAK